MSVNVVSFIVGNKNPLPVSISGSNVWVATLGAGAKSVVAFGSVPLYFLQRLFIRISPRTAHGMNYKRRDYRNTVHRVTCIYMS